MHAKPFMCSVAALALVAASSNLMASAAPPPIADYINFETPSVHPLALAADGETLALVYAADSALHLYARDDEGVLTPLRRIPVGWEPTSVRAWAGQYWVVNNLSGTVNQVDPVAGVVATIPVGPRPWDLLPVSEYVACVTLDLYNELVCFDRRKPTELTRQSLPIGSPRHLARAGETLMVGNFHSGNASTVLGGGITDPRRLAYPPNVVNLSEGPHGGQNPPFNADEGFAPALRQLPEPPPVGLIVRKDHEGHWRDDSGADWSPWVSGEHAAESGRFPGWDLPDDDVYALPIEPLLAAKALPSGSRSGGHLSTVMALAADADRLVMAGIQARNQLRFEPNLRGRFVAHRLVLGSSRCKGRSECKPALRAIDLPAELSEVRALALGDSPAHIYLAARGSDRVGVLDGQGAAIAERPPLALAAGPEGLIVDVDGRNLYVWSRFDGVLSRVDLRRWEVVQTVTVQNPEPDSLRRGRRWLYSTSDGSSNGRQSCAGCHIDARNDRLAWDLGNPSGEMKAFNQNCVTHAQLACPDWHPMKGPMRTQSLVDVIGHEPLHWRGDRQSIHDFASTYTDLQGRSNAPSATQIQQLTGFLASLAFPPNAYRELDNALPTALALDAIPGLGQLSDGQSLSIGNAQRGERLFRSGRLAQPFDCSSCHTLPTGLGTGATMFTGGKRLPAGPNGEAHLGITGLTGISQVGLKIPQLRGLEDGLGMSFADPHGTQGFGYASDGSVPSLPTFLRFRGFNIGDARAYADLLAYLLAFSGGPQPTKHDIRHPAGPPGRAVHAGAGWQASWRADGDPPIALDTIIDQVEAGNLALGLFSWDEGECQNWRWRDGAFHRADGSDTTVDDLGDSVVTALAVPDGHAERWLRCEH